VPALLLALLLRAGRRHRGGGGRDALQLPLAGAAAAETEEDTEETEEEEEERVYARLLGTFGFCIGDFRPGCYWFEPLDLFRKLALTGLLQFAARGTAAQVRTRPSSRGAARQPSIHHQHSMARHAAECEKDTKVAQKLGQLQPFSAVFPMWECTGHLAYFGPT
jgi:hypothetical protein